MINDVMAFALNSPATGDTFSPVTIAIIAGIAVVAMIVTAIFSKKDKDE